MSTSKALIPYQNETRAHAEHVRPSSRRESRSTATPPRSGAFLVQLMLGAEPALRRPLGRVDVADQREQAYGGALANRPSARPLGFLHRIADA